MRQNGVPDIARRYFLFALFFLLLTACQFSTTDRSGTSCGPSTLNFGGTEYEIKSIDLNADGSVDIPSNQPGTVFWVEGTDLQYTFILSPTPENIDFVKGIPEGTTAKVAWSNCSSMTFVLSAPLPGSFGITYLPEQSTASIAIFVESDTEGNGYVIGGGITGE